MNGCVYAHIGDDGAVLCDRYSDFGRGIISYCDDICLDKHPSNADRIRAMSDEELADELLEWFACFMAVKWSRDMILNWLKKEVTT